MTDDRRAIPDASLIEHALGFLHELATEHIEPADALTRLERFRAHLRTDARLDLVWDVEPYDGSVHYDLIVRFAGGVTTSLAVAAADDGLPWPLRGAQRVGDKVLLEVDGERLDVADAVSCLDAMADEFDIVERLVDTAIVRRELTVRPVAVTDHAIDAAMDAFRRSKGLRSAADTRQWMARRGMTTAALGDLAVEMAKIGAMRRRIEEEGGTFADWITQRRSAAVINWCWAPPGQRGAAVPA